MFFGLSDLNPLVRGMDPAPDLDPSLSHKGVQQTEIPVMLTNKILTQNFSKILKF
jgi:hypothetical protein